MFIKPYIWVCDAVINTERMLEAKYKFKLLRFLLYIFRKKNLT